MTLATLSDVLRPAMQGGYAVAGFVVLGWEDMRACVAAAELEDAPVILQAGPNCRAHTPLPVLASMLRHLAEQARVPVVLHLDHGRSIDDCRAALDVGFSSVMFDGSRLPLRDNIAATATVVEMAHAAGAGCEGEIGRVGYAGGAKSHGTDPEEAEIFARETGVDAMAVSVGNLHLQHGAGQPLDMPLLHAIEARTKVPLVIHGGSGVAPEQRRDIATGSTVCKVNIGTELRRAFGSALRAELAADPRVFDRCVILAATEDPVCQAARAAIRSLRPKPEAR